MLLPSFCDSSQNITLYILLKIYASEIIFVETATKRFLKGLCFPFFFLCQDYGFLETMRRGKKNKCKLRKGRQPSHDGRKWLGWRNGKKGKRETGAVSRLTERERGVGGPRGGSHNGTECTVVGPTSGPCSLGQIFCTVSFLCFKSTSFLCSPLKAITILLTQLDNIIIIYISNTRFILILLWQISILINKTRTIYSWISSKDNIDQCC